MFYIKFILTLVVLSGLLGGCGYGDAYEEVVYDREPVYCYQSLAGVECFRKPNQSDKRRIINFYGPDPTFYPEPKATIVPELKAPRAIDYWVKDPEPTREQIIDTGL